ncbi:zinc finger protein GIS [Brassica rapa]|uniref:C2H2-type domain-containing protein n=1 Tax=Brassica campestris TaxID=3711 RepID=M4CNQ2_BRACM|nr:zinc finger protein GIS [Brassica rapa]
MDPVDMLSSESSYGSDVSDDGIATELMEQATYKCNYCPKTYSKGQALGGHQNVHKREREITKRQERAMLVNMNPPDPYPYPHPFPSQYALPSGFEQRRYIIDEPDILHVVYNSSQSPYQSVMAQPHTRSLLPASSPICLKLCLGVGSSSQDQTQTKEPNDATREMDAEKEDHDLSLYLSLKL